MRNVQVILENDNVMVYIGDKYNGSIKYSSNLYHNGHYYLKLQLQNYDTEVAEEVFFLLSQRLDKPMQVMVSSKDEEIISFIQTAGFRCRRKCYEIEACVQDYIGKIAIETLSFAAIGHAIYEKCCEIMLDRYISTHKAINPWTGTKEDFFKMLPKMVFYEMEKNRIKNFAFVEDNEIAYVCGVDRAGFVLFAQNLITEIFKQNESIIFEADDCDEYAMELKNLFASQSDESFDTYILK